MGFLDGSLFDIRNLVHTINPEFLKQERRRQEISEYVRWLRATEGKFLKWQKAWEYENQKIPWDFQQAFTLINIEIKSLKEQGYQNLFEDQNLRYQDIHWIDVAVVALVIIAVVIFIPVLLNFF